MCNQNRKKFKNFFIIFSFFIIIFSNNLYASTGYLYTSGKPIMEIDLATGLTTRIIDMYGFGLAYLNPNILLVTDSNHSLYIFNLENLNQIKVIDNIGPCARNVYVTPDDKFAFVLNNDANNLSVIDLSNFSYLKNITVGGPSYSGPNGLAFDPVNHLAYVSNHYGSPDISIIDYVSLMKVGEIDYDGFKPKECGIHLDDNLLYIANGGGGGNNSLTIYDLTISTVLKTLGTGTDPSGLIMSKDFQKVYLSCIGSSLIQILDTNTNEFIKSIGMGGYPAYPCINDDGTLICFSQEIYNCVSVINVETDQIIATYSVGDGPRCVLFGPSNEKPIANAGPDQIVECTSCCATEVTLDGTGSYDPDGDPLAYHWTWDGGEAYGEAPTITLPLDTTTITLVVNDGLVDSEPDYVDIIIEDTTPPMIEVTVTPDQLWPPNHKMVDILADVTVSDLCDQNPVWNLLSITSNEPEEGPGKKHSPDIMGHEPGTQDVEFQLRAERLGGGEGRIYTIIYEVADGSGNMAFAEAQVTVPHDMGKKLAKVSMPTQPYSYNLLPNFPNPFNPETSITYVLPEETQVTMIIYNSAGEKITTLVHGRQDRGYHSVTWNGRDASGRPVSGGIYFCRIQAGSYQETIRMLLLK